MNFQKIIMMSCLFAMTSFALAQKKADLTGALYCQNKEMQGLLDAPEAMKADRIVVQKKYKKLYLLSKNQIVKSYDIAMGPNAEKGPKAFEGDSKTPEGIYNIAYKNPKSNYYMALKVSYPNAKDVTYAQSMGKNPGDFIMIHGFPVKPIDGLTPQVVKDQQHPMVNWTRGCMAVTDREIEEIYSLVREKTTIEICPL
jgi:murein L,D-transpeptidase YafK